MNVVKGNLKISDYQAPLHVNVDTAPVIDLSLETFLGFQNSNDTNGVNFHGSLDGQNFGTLHRVTSTNDLASTAVYRFYCYDAFTWVGLKYLKITKATTAATIKIVTEVY